MANPFASRADLLALIERVSGIEENQQTPTRAKNQIYKLNGQPALSTSNTASLNSRIARVERVVPYKTGGGSFAPSRFSPLVSDGVVDGKINLGSSAAFKMSGGLSPNVIDGQFSFACPSDSTVTIYWDGTNLSKVILIRRADGTSTTVTPANITVSGLTASVKYQAFASWPISGKHGLGWGPGQHGTPQIAIASTDADTLAAQAQATASQMGREFIGNLSWTQPGLGGTSSASTTTLPPTRQIGTCVMLGTRLEPLGSIRPEDWVTEEHPETDWIQIVTHSGRLLNCTLNHPLYDADGWQKKAEWFSSGKWIITDSGKERVDRTCKFYANGTKVQVKMRHGHLFWANGFLGHNIKLPQS